VGVFFIFSKLSIRVPGKYRLLFSVRLSAFWPRPTRSTS